MAKFRIKTDQGTFIVTTEGDTPPTEEEIFQFISTQQRKRPSSLARVSAQATFPPTTSPIARTPAGKISQLGRATFENLAPTSPDQFKRLFSPTAGQFGLGRLFESAGAQVGQAVRGAGLQRAEQLAESRIGQRFPRTAATVGAAGSSIADLFSEGLRPSTLQQSLGSEGFVRSGIPVIQRGAARTGQALSGVATDLGRRALGFTKRFLTSPKSSFEGARKLARANRAASETLKQRALKINPEETSFEIMHILEKSRSTIDNTIKMLDSQNVVIDSVKFSSTLRNKLKPTFRNEVAAVNDIMDDIKSISSEISPFRKQSTRAVCHP